MCGADGWVVGSSSSCYAFAWFGSVGYSLVCYWCGSLGCTSGTPAVGIDIGAGKIPASVVSACVTCSLGTDVWVTKLAVSGLADIVEGSCNEDVSVSTEVTWMLSFGVVVVELFGHVIANLHVSCDLTVLYSVVVNDGAEAESGLTCSVHSDSVVCLCPASAEGVGGRVTLSLEYCT